MAEMEGRLIAVERALAVGAASAQETDVVKRAEETPPPLPVNQTPASHWEGIETLAP